MKKTIYTVLILLVCAICVLCFAACRNKKPDQTPSGENQNPSSGVVEDVIYSPNTKPTLVLGEGVSARDVSRIKSAYFDIFGEYINVSSSMETTSLHEIIVGKTSRDISSKAYRALELAKNEDGTVGYAVYSDGRSVAIAFDGASFGENVALAVAVDDFVEMYMQSKTLKLSKGVVHRTTFDPMEKQTERDGDTFDLLWNLKLSQITDKIGGDAEAAEAIVSSIKKLHSIYNNGYSTVKWIANLYDPETGGFYYSNSARNNIGYLPDLESTSQALAIVEMVLSGYSGNLTDYFGDEIAGKFVSFAKDMQDINGYFYHPQWTRELVDKNVAKRSRDVYNALLILDFFSATPTYDTPNGVKGESSIVTASKLTAPLSLNNVTSVVKVVSAQSDEIYVPNHLKTKENFESYLSNLDIKANTATVSEELYSDTPLYLAIDEILEEQGAGYRLTDILENYLRRNQNPITGLWSDNYDNNDGVAISDVPGVVRLYNALGIPVYYYSELIFTIVSAIESLDNPERITEITELWSALSAVVSNVRNYSDETQMVDVDRHLESVYQDFEDLINQTIKNVALFAEMDGSFSSTSGKTLGDVMGMPTSLSGIEEGDVSATFLATKVLWLSIFGALDVGSVPIFYTSDRMMFQKTFLDLGIIIKNEVKNVEPLDFEDYDLGETPDIRYRFYSDDSKAVIVKDSSRKSNVAELYSASNKGDHYEIYYFDVMSSVTNASCFSYELDMCVLPGTSDGVFAQLYLYDNAQMISLSRSGDTINFYENSDRTSSIARTMDIGVTAQIEEWFNLRVEYYPAPSGSLRIKIYFNDECVVVSDNYYGSHSESSSPATDFSCFAIYAYYNKSMDLLVDDVAVEKTYKTYTVETGCLNRNVDYPEKNQTIHDFEKDNLGDTPVSFKPSNAVTGAVVKSDSNGNRLLAVSEEVGEIILPLDSRGNGINSALVEFDFVLAHNSKSGASYQISFNEYKYDKTVFGSMFIITNEENGNVYATVSNVISNNVRDTYEDVKMFVGEKHRISFRIFFAERVIVVSVDDVVIGLNSNVSNMQKYYLGEIKLVSKTPSIDSEILIDNVVVEKSVSNFEEAIAPNVDRVVNEFDSTDGVEISGASISSGVLSFEGAGKDAYAKIPVNRRASSPIFSFVEFDVSLVGNALGDFEIMLSDASGNIIAGFILSLSDKGIGLHEFTENGKYTTPMYTFNKSTFKFAIEYSHAKGTFNFLVDGTYVAASSITYGADSVKYNFEYLIISTNGNVGVTIDNLVVESIIAIFKTHAVLTPNTDPVDGVYTFETSSFASLPSTIERGVGDETAGFNVRERKVNDAVSKVLEINCGTGAGATHATFIRSKTLKDSNAAYFETDVMLESTTSSLWMLFELQSSERTAYSVEIQSLSNDKGAAFTINSTKLSVNEGEWFRLRVEYRDASHDFDYDGLNDVVVRIYVNGEFVMESHTPKSKANVVKSSDVSRLRVRNMTGRTGIIYLDNMTLGECNMTYTPPAPPDTDTLTYEPGIVTNLTKGVLGKTTSTLRISSLTVAGEVTKVLDLYTSKGSYDEVSIYSNLTAPGANAVMFETDLMIAPESDMVSLSLEPKTSRGNQPLKFTITAEDGGVVRLYSVDSLGVIDPDMKNGILLCNSGEWIKLKIEYMNPREDYTGDGVDDILCRIYVDGVLVKTLYKPYLPGAYYKPADISRFVLSAASDSAANIYLDNTRFWYVKLEYDVVPEREQDVLLGEGYSPIGGVDPDGWSKN